MNDTLLGIIIGGAIAIIPNVLTLLADFRKEKLRHTHELRIRRLDLVDAPRMDALREFADQLGALYADNLSDIHHIDLFLASMQKASLYVTPETIGAMHAAEKIVMQSWDPDAVSPLSREEILGSPQISHLNECLRREMRLIYEEPSSSGLLHQKLLRLVKLFDETPKK